MVSVYRARPSSDFSFPAKPFRMEELRRRVEDRIGIGPQGR